jgi:hypothetical protein
VHPTCLLSKVQARTSAAFETREEPGALHPEARPRKFTAQEAHRAGKLYLPPSYELQYDADVLLLRRDDGSVAAAFSARG